MLLVDIGIRVDNTVGKSTGDREMDTAQFVIEDIVERSRKTFIDNKRDEIAIAAMQGLIGETYQHYEWDGIATRSYDMAEAMLKERAKRLELEK